jgi:hypothetical protein
MLRWKLAGVGVTLALLVGGGAAMRVGASVVSADRSVRPPQILQLFYTAPVLVRAGERVTIPVDVICATAEGQACSATARITVSSAGAMASRAVPAMKGLEFDVTGPARRGLGSDSSGRVDFVLTATAGDGRAVSFPAKGGSLAFYVTRSMPVVHVRAVPFGQVRKPKTVLFLPWGSGPMRAGLSPGLESATLGPSSFDVDAAGRIHLVDSLQERVAVFDAGRLVREVHIPIGAEGMLAVARGSSYLLDSTRGEMSVRPISRDGVVQGHVSLGEGIASQIRAVNGEVYANVLPLDAWVKVAGSPLGVPIGPGMPLPDGRQLVRVGREDSVRLGLVQEDRIVDALEIRSGVKFGGVTLAEPDGYGGYLVVVRTWRDGTHPADQFQVIRVTADRTVQTFAVASRFFADAAPLGQFRLGPDGALYQMRSSPDGIRIVRFNVEEGLQ